MSGRPPIKPKTAFGVGVEYSFQAFKGFALASDLCMQLRMGPLIIRIGFRSP